MQPSMLSTQGKKNLYLRVYKEKMQERSLFTFASHTS